MAEELAAPVEYSAIVSLSDLPPRRRAKSSDESARTIDFGTVAPGETSSRVFMLSNDSDETLEVNNAVVYGQGAGSYSVNFQDARTPVLLAPNQTVDLEVIFQGQGMGANPALLTLVHSGVPRGHVGPTYELYGISLGEKGAELLINSGGTPRMDAKGQIWTSDLGSSSGRTRRLENPPTGTADDELFETLRVGKDISYSLEVPNGEYEVTLYLSEGKAKPQRRSSPSVRVQGEERTLDGERQTSPEGFTTMAATIGASVVNGLLSISVAPAIHGPNIGVGGIEVRGKLPPIPNPFKSELTVTPGSLDFGFVLPGSSLELDLTLKNASPSPLILSDIGFFVGAMGGTGNQLSIEIEGQIYQGISDNALVPATLILRPGQSTVAEVEFSPTLNQINDMTLVLKGNFKAVGVPVIANGGVDTKPFLHVVIDGAEDPIVDYDQNGTEMVTLDGTFSHTHYPGAALATHTWTDGGTVIGTTPIITVPMTIGTHEICLTIEDDTTPVATLVDCETLVVASPNGVPGVLAFYYVPRGGQTPTTMLSSPLPKPSFVETRDSLELTDDGGVGGSPFNDNMSVRLVGIVTVPISGNYNFDTTGGAGNTLFVSGNSVTSSSQDVLLTAGRHSVVSRIAVNDLNDLPYDILMAPSGGTLTPILASDLSHNELLPPPVINSITASGSVNGGDLVTIGGFAFFLDNEVTVNWGGVPLTLNDFESITPDTITLLAPAHAIGSIDVTVASPRGLSNTVNFMYTSTFVPVNFALITTSATSFQPTAGDWGPDGRFYVIQRNGFMRIYTFDEDYNVTATQTVTALNGTSNHEALGLCFNPFDPPSPVKVYVGHSDLFAQGGGSFTGPSPYTGQVSVLTGPTFTPTPLITGLPTSNHDHAVNGMQFDNNGDLLIAIGGNTNAGVAAPLIGDIAESPFTAAIVKAELSKPGFNGTVTYVDTVGGSPNDDQVFGESVDVAPGVDVSVQASGLRNAYDIVYTLDGRLFSTSNGPNWGYGPESTGPTTQAGELTEADRLDFIEYSNYYGAANRSRGRYDSRQNIFRSIFMPDILGEYVAPLEILSSSTNGLAEYRADAFDGGLRGELLAQRWNGQIRRFQMAADSRSVVASSDFKNLNSLDVQVGPGGAILGLDYSGAQIKVMIPNDSGAVGLTVYDIFPNRAPATGGQPFVIGGSGFGTLGDTSVLIDGLPATLTSVTSKRIEGTIPVQASPTTELVDIQVTVSASVDVVTDCFRYLFATPGLEPGRWRSSDSLPGAVGEVAAGIIDGIIYVVGEGDTRTMSYDLGTEVWSATLPNRPFLGNHHTAEVVDGKLYLIGGLGAGSAGKVQIFDPVAGTWSTGADMPWSAGSASSGIIDGKIYVTGGIAGGATITTSGVYDPVMNSWTLLASMPFGRNHAAGTSDGSRLYVFGGRTGGNTVSNGFDDVQIYDPLLDSWIYDKDGVSGLAPLPQARGGTGRALFYQGEFYVMGGETLTGAGATVNNVYDRVDVYDPVANTWRLDASMITARHGTYPVLYQSRMFLPGGGTTSAFSQTTIVEEFTRQ